MPLLRSGGALAAAAFIALSSPALAHLSFERAEAAPNSTYKAVLRVPHGCQGQPTIKIRVRIPEGVVAVKPMPKPGWSLETAKGSYVRAYQAHGETVSEGVTDIVWSGSLDDAHYDEFVFQAQFTDAFQPGATVYFPVVQECANHIEEWIEVPTAAQEAQGLRTPAPGVRIVAAAGEAPAAQASALAVEQPWLRATPAGAKVGGGYARIVNKGQVPDRLTGGSFPVAARVEIHDMWMDGTIARMRPAENGLEIGPGATVELKPGGTHLMLVDLKEPLKEGQVLKGTLTFEKAGTVEVEFPVRAMGGSGAAPAEHKH